MLSVLPAPLSPLKEEEEESRLMVLDTREEVLYTASPPNSQLPEVWNSSAISYNSQTATEDTFKLAEYNIQNKIQAILRLYTTFQMAF